MRMTLFGSALVLATGLIGGPAFAAGISGDYVEARSCNVFVGACHYSGEYMTAGREALLVWHVSRGARGTLLAGGSYRPSNRESDDADARGGPRAVAPASPLIPSMPSNPRLASP